MKKQIIRKSQDTAEDAAGLDLLRELASYPHRAVLMHRRQEQHRTVIIQRDALGRIIGSTERIEESDITDLDGQWTD